MVAHAHGADRIVEELALRLDRAEGLLGRQAEVSQALDARVDDEPLALIQAALAAEKPEQVARFQIGRAEGEEAALVALDAVAAMHPLVPAQRVDHAHQPDGGHVGGQHLDPFQRQRHRHAVVDAQPAHRQQLAVADRQVQFDRLADEGAPLAEVAPVFQRAQRQPVPRPRHDRYQRQQPGDQDQAALAEDQPGHEEDDGDRDPCVAELGLLAGVDDQPAAQAACAGDRLRRGHAAAHHGRDDQGRLHRR